MSKSDVTAPPGSPGGRPVELPTDDTNVDCRPPVARDDEGWSSSFPPPARVAPGPTELDEEPTETNASRALEKLEGAEANAPRTIPGSVRIRTASEITDPADELLDETEVRTVSNEVPLTVVDTLRSAERHAGHDDAPTYPRADAEAPPASTEASTLPRPPITAGYPSDLDEESVTTRARATELRGDDGVATEVLVAADVLAAPTGPRLPEPIVAPRVAPDTSDDGVDRRRITRSFSDAETESVTAKTPKAVTNILRVIASETASADGVARALPDEPPGNSTAVMPNAPLKRILTELAASPLLPPQHRSSPAPHTVPLAGARARAAVAHALDPSSSSGLRLAGDAESGERLVGSRRTRRNEHPSSGARAPNRGFQAALDEAAAARAMAATKAALPAMASDEDASARKPRYGMLVFVVAVLSIAIPVSVFFVLKRAPEAAVPEVRSEAAKDKQSIDPPRAKFDRSAKPSTSASGSSSGSASATASPSASASASGLLPASGHKPPPRSPGGILLKR